MREAMGEMLVTDVVLEVTVACAAEDYPPEMSEALFVERPAGDVAEGYRQGGMGANPRIESIDHLGDGGTADGFG